MAVNKQKIFQDLTEKDFEELLSTECMTTKSYRKGSAVWNQGDKIHSIGIIRSGGVNIESIDVWGNRSILSHCGAGEVFGESYAMANKPLMIDVICTEKTELFFLDIKKAFNDGKLSSGLSSKLYKNLMMISVEKNLMLSARIFHTQPKTIRERVMSYLSDVSITAGSKDFDIPFDRQSLADYLNLDRSALSKELGKMQDDGIIACRKNHFTLL